MSLRGEVACRICGQDRAIAPKFKAIEAIETRLDQSLVQLLMKSAKGELKAREMAVIVYEGARAVESANLPTLEAIGEDMLVRFADYSGYVGQFLANSVGAGDAKKNDRSE